MIASLIKNYSFIFFPEIVLLYTSSTDVIVLFVFKAYAIAFTT